MAERSYLRACKASGLVGALFIAQAATAQEQCDCRTSSPSKDVPPGVVKIHPKFDFSWRSRAGKIARTDCIERVVANTNNSDALYYAWELAGMRNKSLPPGEKDQKCRPSAPPREPIETGPLLYGRSDTQSVTTQVWKSMDEPPQASAAKTESFSETLKVAFQVDGAVLKHTVVVLSSVKRQAGSEDYTYDYTVRSTDERPAIVRWGIFAELDPKSIASNPSISGQLIKTTDGQTAVMLKEPIKISIKDRRQPVAVESWMNFFSPKGEEMAAMRTHGFVPTGR